MSLKRLESFGQLKIENFKIWFKNITVDNHSFVFKQKVHKILRYIQIL